MRLEPRLGAERPLVLLGRERLRHLLEAVGGALVVVEHPRAPLEVAVGADPPQRRLGVADEVIVADLEVVGDVRGGAGARYTQAGLLALETLFDPGGPYVSASAEHQGLLLHSIYHRPNGWDHVPPGARAPRGESSMWGDYHAREAALYVQRLCAGPYLTFFGGERTLAPAASGSAP